MNLKQKIREKLTEQNISVAALEKKAGLRMSAVRNILRGQTKKPSAYTLKKIALAFDCKIDDLLVDENLASNNEYYNREGRQKISIKLEDPEFLLEVGEAVVNLLKAKSIDANIDQTLKVIKESYFYSVKSNPRKVDHRFIEWMIEKMI